MTYPIPFAKYEHPLRLLVIDDQEFDRKMICARLREVSPDDATIIEAASGEEALRAIANTPLPFDCVLIDMNLPDIHGVELTSRMLARNPELCIVIITVEADMEKAIKCLKAGAEDFLIKGEYSNMGLYRSMRYAIERRRTTVENIRLGEDLKRARELSTAQKEFIHLISHEFRTPISIISGAVQLLQAKAPELYSGAGATQFKKIESSIERLVNLLDNVLRLSLVEEGKEIFSPQTFDMVAAIHSVAGNFDEKRMELELPTERQEYYGDQRLVEYALHNVISNAMKYSPADTKVHIGLSAGRDKLVVSVTDKGPGMSAEMIARAGEKFYRDAKTSHIEGSGLGIHLAKRFMEYHKGELVFESKEGAGTTVHLHFPNGASVVPMR